MDVNELMREKAALKMIRACFEFGLTVKCHRYVVEVFDGDALINSVAIDEGDSPEDIMLQAIYDCVRVTGMMHDSVFG